MNATAIATSTPVTIPDDAAKPNAPKLAPTKAEAVHEFAKQLEKATATDTKPPIIDLVKQVKAATKPTVKKPTIAIEPGAPPEITTDPGVTALAQILAALVTTTATATPDATPIKAAITEASTQKATAIISDAPEQTKAAIVEQMVVSTKVATAATEPPLTPLEQAVHDMLTELADHKDGPKPDAITITPTLQLTATPIAPSETITEAKPAAPLAAQQPQELVSQNHAHLVFDDPNGRIVMTVAVRGSEVNVSIRASDDATGAALARNAGSLEQAMRGRGLQLAQFDSQRDLTREQREKPMYEKATVKKSDGERFTLEENS